MALKSNNTALAVAIQSVRDTFTAPNSTTDLLSGMSNLRLQIDAVTIADDSYTGSIFRNADQIAGKRVSLSFNMKMKPPSSLPAANAFVPGRVLQAGKFTELRGTAAIPVAPEALDTGVDAKTAKLGSSAAATLNLYKGLPILIGSGAYKEKLTAIRSYAASREAVLMEDWGSTPSGDYQIPQFLGYFRDVSSADPALLSLKLWISGHRYDLLNCGVTGLRMLAPTSTKQQAAFPEFEFTLEATIEATAEEATPTITAVGAVPLFKDGKMMMAYKEVGTQNVTIDLGLTSENPPNPNKVDGTDAPELSGGSATASVQMQKYLPSHLDTLSLADAQGYHPLFLQWGNAAWNAVQITVPDGRLSFPNPDLSGGVAMENVDVFVDVMDRNLGIVFPG